MLKRLLLFIMLVVAVRATFGQKESLIFPQIEGWSLGNPIQLYNNDNLWNIIDGAADVFLKYDFEEMQMAQYTRPDSTYILVESYKHKTNEDAFGVYSQERPAVGNYFNIGTEGYREPGMLNFLIANYYIKIRSVSSDSNVQAAIGDIANGISSKFDKNQGFPPVLSLFPEQDKILHSEQLISKDFLGYSFFEDFYQASYKMEGKKYTVFIVKRNNPAQIDEILSKYYQYLKKKYKKNKDEIYKIKDPNNGTITIIVRNNIMAGIIDLNDAKIKDQMATRLKINLSNPTQN